MVLVYASKQKILNRQVKQIKAPLKEVCSRGGHRPCESCGYISNCLIYITSGNMARKSGKNRENRNFSPLSVYYTASAPVFKKLVYVLF